MALFIPRFNGSSRTDLIAAEDGTSENNRKARFYRLTAKGPDEGSSLRKFEMASAL